MNVLALLVPIAVFLGGSFVAFFFWAVRAGQYDDLETPAYRILTHDSEKPHLQGTERK